MKFNEQGYAVLVGDGSYGFEVIVDGEDLVARRVPATWFGGSGDSSDTGMTASGVPTKNNPTLCGCALPMDIGKECPPTEGAPLPQIPWFTHVRVFNPITHQQVTIKLIDIGPARPPAAHGAIDLTQAAFEALGVHLAQGVMTVDYRVLGGAKYLSASVLAEIKAHQATKA